MKPLALAPLLLLAGCETMPTTVTVRVPVPVACQVATPERPVLAIDTMSPDLPLDVQNRHMRADHDERDGYEGRLETALATCKNPVVP